MRREKMKNRSLRSWVIIVLPCTSRKALRTHDSQKGIEEILNSKLATILEEPENVYDIHGSNIEGQDDQSKKLLWFKGKNGKDLFRARLFKRSRLHLLDSHNLCCFKGSYYINFLAGFVPKGSLIGLSR